MGYLTQSEVESLIGIPITATSVLNSTDFTNFSSLIDGSLNSYLGITTNLTSGPVYLACRSIASSKWILCYNLKRTNMQQSSKDIDPKDVREITNLTIDEQNLLNPQKQVQVVPVGYTY